MPLRGGSPSSSSGGTFDNPNPSPVAPRPGVADPEDVDDDVGEKAEDERARSFSLK